MNDSLFTGISSYDKRKTKRAPFPRFVPPMLATLTSSYFSSDDWIYEHKFDGERCLAFKKNGTVRLMSRNKRIINKEYPELVTALEKQKADNFVIDGEIIAKEKGVSNFELLQSRINLKNLAAIKEKTKNVPISYAIFDLMYVHGYDIRNVPLLARKKILKKLLSYNKILHYTEHKVGNGIPFFKEACKLHWEGLIAKKSDGIYLGKRSLSWLKFKCIMKQELVIGGYTDPRKSRIGFGALLVGYYKDGKLRFAGKVGTGYTEEILKILGKRLKSLEIKKCPFINYDETLTGVHWVKPILVAEFQFAQWTNDDKLRVGRYKGLRDDKKATDVVKEVPKAIAHIPT